MEDKKVLYLVGFSETDERSVDVEAIAEQFALQWLDVGGVRGWYCLFDAAMFEGADAEANLANLEWLTPRVMLHESAVSQLAAEMPFFPTRFGTLFSGEQPLAASIHRWREDLARFFELVRGRSEWGIKVWSDSASLDKHLLQTSLDSSSETPTGGASYLRLRKAQQNLSGTRDGYVEYVASSFESLCCEQQIPIIRRRTTIHSDDSKDKLLLANLAVLLERDNCDLNLEQFTRLIEAMRFGECLTVESTGPWAAYSFCPALN